MEAIYHLSVLLLVLCFLGLPILLIVFLIKPHLLNNRSFIKKPFSRGKITLLGTLIFFVAMFSFGGTMAATEPDYIKQERVARELAEEKASKDAEAQKQKDEEAKKPIVKQEHKVEVIAFETIEEQDGALAKGEKRVATEGENGERTITYDVMYVEGKETGRSEVKNEVTKQPVTKVVKAGAYIAPATPPQATTPSVSNSAYYANCTAARAAGVAPVYIGQPGYGKHLDKDGDGVGCE